MSSFRLIVAAAAVLLCGCGVFGGGEAAETPTVVSDDVTDGETSAGTDGINADCSLREVVCIGIVLGPGGIEERSLLDLVSDRQSAVASIELVSVSDTSQVELQLGAFIDQSVDLLVVGGAGTSELILEAAERNEELTFVSLGVVQSEDLGSDRANLIRVEIDMVDAAFTAGAAAALMSQSGKVGAVFGADTDPLTADLRLGWENGARFVNPEIELFTTFHPGGPALGFTDPAWGAETANGYVEAGVDVIFGAGAMTGNGALVESARLSGAESATPRCIGAFAEQWVATPEARPCLLSSVAIDIETPLADLLDGFIDGDDLSGEVAAVTSLSRLRDVPDGIAEQIDQISFQIAQGGIETRN